MYRCIVSLVLALVWCRVALGLESANTFTEELLIRPLATGHIYSHFEFITTWTSPEITNTIEGYQDFEFSHYDLFPRALGEIVERYHVRELHLSLTQGLWRHRKWGYPVLDAPPGAQLWVWFNPTDNNLDQTWRDLVNALSGLVCASLNFIDSTNTVSPELSYRPQGLAEDWYAKNSSLVRYAALPRENVCTENLTPWKKLLPCHTQSGLSTLLHPGPLYTAHYHSLSLHLRPVCQDSSCSEPQLELTQGLSLVQAPGESPTGRPDWSLRRLFSAPLVFSCPLAAASNIYIDITENKNFHQYTLSPPPDTVEESGRGASVRRLAVYDTHKALVGEPFDLASSYTHRLIHGLVPPPPLHVLRFVTGYGQEGGSITVQFVNNGPTPLTVVYLEVLPWYLRLFLHTSHSRHQLQSLYVAKLVTARDRERGWLYEAVLQVPGGGSKMEISLEFSRALLKWLEYPPDANHGFYIPAATVSCLLPTPRNISSDLSLGSTLREKLKVREGRSFVRVHTETLLVSLPTPDFSMPYNVICLACTVVALAFGPIHNITTKKLVLRKVEARDPPLKRLVNSIRAKWRVIRRLGKAEEKKEGASDGKKEGGKDPIEVEENPLFDDREEDLADIAEEEEEEEEDEKMENKRDCKMNNKEESKKDR